MYQLSRLEHHSGMTETEDSLRFIDGLWPDNMKWGLDNKESLVAP